MQMRKLISMFIVLFLTLSLTHAFASGANAKERFESRKTASGISATLVITPEKSMIDLYLKDEATGKEIRTAKASALIASPDGGGKKTGKELIGMEMDGAYSYMNSLDMSLKGRYILDIQVEHGRNKVLFKFTYEKR